MSNVTGRLGSFRFYIHPIYLLLGVALALVGQLYIFVVYTIVLVLHELGHAFVANRLGYALNELCLMPYGAVLKGCLDGVKTRDEVLIAVAGPITNVVFSLFSIALWWIAPITYYFTDAFAVAGLVNAAFNLIPVYPLDGGLALFAMLKDKYGVIKASRVMHISGIVISSVLLVCCALLAVFSYNLTYGIIGCFVFLSALFRGKRGEYLRIAGNYNEKALKRGIEVREYAVSEDATVLDLMRLVNSLHLVKVVVLDGSGKVVKTIDETRLREEIEKGRVNKSVREIR